MDLISITNNWPKNVFNIDINLGNYCNYKCWYCFPGANEGTHKFPNAELLIKNLEHLINYYKTETDKTVFDIHFSGGEVTHWKEFSNVLHHLKSKFNCLLSLTSNGSKKISWWEENSKYFDRIHMSYHHQFADITHFRNLCDLLYEKKVVVSASVMMDPFAWDKCIDAVNYLKQSKHRWTIRYVEIYDSRVEYTEEQKKLLKQHRARSVNLWFFFRNNKYFRSRVTGIDTVGKKHFFEDHEIIFNRINNFFGWKCSAGVNWINISKSGDISATCGQMLYNKNIVYNLYDPEFTKKFYPRISSTICSKLSCMCLMESVMPKEKIQNKKTINIIEIKNES